MATGDAVDVCKKVMILPKVKSVLECLFTCTELNQGHGYLLVSEEVHIHSSMYIEENPCGPSRTHKKTCEDASAAITAEDNVSVLSWTSCLVHGYIAGVWCERAVVALSDTQL